jgi:hypothetical protein
MSSFRNRNDWVSHLALEHYEPDWESITCPLCFETVEQGKIATTRHLASHLEEISLSALPSNPDEDVSDDDSEVEIPYEELLKQWIQNEGGRDYHSASSGGHARFANLDDLSIYPSSFRQSIIEASRVGSNDSNEADLTADSPAVNHDSPIGSDSEEPYTIKCICISSNDDGNTIYCETCDTWQHIRCFYPDNFEEAIREDFAHSCAECKPRPLDRQRAWERMHRHK